MSPGPRLALLAAAVFLVGYQARFSAETVEARSTFLYIPFGLEPCSNRIAAPGLDELPPGSELLAVNGRAFTGAAVYHQELRGARRYLDAVRLLPSLEAAGPSAKWPFRVTARTPSGETKTGNIYFANCTCGSLTMRQVIWYCLLPPALCLLLGLAGVAFRPQSDVAWLFLAVAVCLSQVALVPGLFNPHWSQQANPLEWRDWFRIPALAYQTFFTASWSAWLLLFAACCFAPAGKRTFVWWAVAPTLLFAALKTLAAVGAAERFALTAPLYHALEANAKAAQVLLLLCSALVLWGFGKAWTLAASGLAALAAASLYWPYPAAYLYWLASYHVESVVPTAVRTPELVSALFTALLLLMLALAAWRARPGGAAVAFALVLLLAPFLYRDIAEVRALWWTPPIPQATLWVWYLGLLLAAGCVIRPLQLFRRSQQ